MRTYELTVILSPSVDPSDDKKITAVIKKILSDCEVTIKSQEIEGKKRLHYPILKNTEGVYIKLTLVSPALKTGKLQKQIKLIPEVLRFLLISKEE